MEKNKFQEILENRHEYARQWKAKTGGKVIGYFETYMPEEIVYAAGYLPVRILAEHEPDDYTDHQMHGNCYPTRDMLNQFQKGRFDYIDGLVQAEGCQWAFLCYQNILNNNPDYFDHYVFVPDYTNAKTSKDLLRSELLVFKNHLEQWGGVTISDEAVNNAIDIYNTFRRLMKRLYNLRKADQPVILGSEAMDVLLACQIMDKAEANVMLENFIDELEEREPQKDVIRVMLLGSETWDSSLEKLIEEAGGNVVIDELENGTSYFLTETIPQKDCYMALSLRYLERPHHPIKDNNWRRRPEHIFTLYEDWQAECVIIAKQIYCHPHGTDNYIVQKLLRERQIPYHFFERDSTMPKLEMMNRLESLFSMVKPSVNRLSGLHNIGEFTKTIPSQV